MCQLGVLSDQCHRKLLLAVQQCEPIGLELLVAGSAGSKLLTLSDELADLLLQGNDAISARTAALGGDPCTAQ